MQRLHSVLAKVAEAYNVLNAVLAPDLEARSESILPAIQQPDGACGVQAVASKDDVAEEVTKWRSQCAELEAAAAKQQVVSLAVTTRTMFVVSFCASFMTSVFRGQLCLSRCNSSWHFVVLKTPGSLLL